MAAAAGLRVKASLHVTPAVIEVLLHGASSMHLCAGARCCRAAHQVCCIPVCLQIQPVRTFASHTGGIWDVQPFSVSCTHPDSCAEESSQLASGCTTCGTDGTICFWDMTQAAGLMKPRCSITTGDLGSLHRHALNRGQRDMAQTHVLNLLSEGLKGHWLCR